MIAKFRWVKTGHNDDKAVKVTRGGQHYVALLWKPGDNHTHYVTLGDTMEGHKIDANYGSYIFYAESPAGAVSSANAYLRNNGFVPA